MSAALGSVKEKEKKDGSKVDQKDATKLGKEFQDKVVQIYNFTSAR